MMTSSPLIAGVDVHRKTNTYCLMTQDGQEVVPHFTLGNNRPETQALIEKVRQAMETGGFTELRLAAEATGWYWFHLFETLQNDPGLQAWPHELFLINPRLTANFKKSYVDLDKSDPIDAYVIADRLRWGRDIKTPYRYDEKLLALRFLTRYATMSCINWPAKKPIAPLSCISKPVSIRTTTNKPLATCLAQPAAPSFRNLLRWKKCG